MSTFKSDIIQEELKKINNKKKKSTEVFFPLVVCPERNKIRTHRILADFAGKAKSDVY